MKSQGTSFRTVPSFALDRTLAAKVGVVLGSWGGPASQSRGHDDVQPSSQAKSPSMSFVVVGQ